MLRYNLVLMSYIKMTSEVNFLIAATAELRKTELVPHYPKKNLTIICEIFG